MSESALQGERLELAIAWVCELEDLPEAEREQALRVKEEQDAQLARYVRGLFAAAHTQPERARSEGPDALIGASFDDYLIVECAGKGGQGWVYRATRKVGCDVAIKVMDWAAPQAGFDAELRRLAPLEHRNIARFIGRGTTRDGRPYFALDYVRGAPITAYCNAKQPAWRERLRLFREICEAVRYAHTQAIIHCDLKPSNIFVDAEGAVRLLDFGIAQRLDQLQPGEVHRLRGTLGYAAPEQYGAKSPSTATDVYALGVVLYELLSGQLPYPIDVQRTMLRQCLAMISRQEQPPLPPSRFALRGKGEPSRSEWRELDAIVLKALAFEPEQRYPSVEALLADLTRLERLEPLTVRSGQLYRLGKFARRNRRTLWAAGVLALGVALVSFALLRGKQETERSLLAQQFLGDVLSGGDAVDGPQQGLSVEAVLARAVDRLDELRSDPLLQANVLTRIARSYIALGKRRRAEQLLQRALTIVHAQRPGSPDEALTLLALGQLAQEQRDFSSALHYGEAASQLVEPWGRFTQNLRATALTLRGMALNALDQPARARDLLEPAARVFRNEGAAPSDVDQLESELANAYLKLHDCARAEPLYRASLELDRQQHGEGSPLVAESWMSLAQVDEQCGDPHAAEPKLAHAVRILIAYRGIDHPQTAGAFALWAELLGTLGLYEDAALALHAAQLRLSSAHAAIGGAPTDAE